MGNMDRIRNRDRIDSRSGMVQDVEQEQDKRQGEVQEDQNYRIRNMDCIRNRDRIRIRQPEKTREYS
jgi:hypothetical protein